MQPPPSLQVVATNEARPYENAVPLLDLQIAAGHFSGEQIVAQDDLVWVALPDTYRIREGLFVARVSGESMNRLIPDGAWCLFRANPTGGREGRVVVVQHRDISDPDTGTHVTVKRYRSEKQAVETGEQWRHVRISLQPHSTHPRYRPIELTPHQAGDLRVVAEFVAVLA